MSYNAILRSIFTPDQIVETLRSLPPKSFPVMDTIFKDRVQLPFAAVTQNDILQNVDELPVINRGERSVRVDNDSYTVTVYQPLAIRHSQMIYADELNDLKPLKQGEKKIWMKNTTEAMLRRYQKTAEAMSALALTGRIEWPVYTPGSSERYRSGVNTYTIDFGTPHRLVMAGGKLKPWSDSEAKIVDVFNTLKAMRKMIRDSGFGSDLEIWAGENAYEKVVAMAQVHPEKSSLSVTIDSNGINVAGFIIKERSETFKMPYTDVRLPVVMKNDVLMIARDAGHKLIYCAVDDLDAGLRAMPFFIKPVMMDDPSAVKLISEGKPFPVVNVKGICRAAVMQSEEE